MNVSEFAGKQPAMVPEQFFDGKLQGWGMEFGPLGGIGRRVQVEAVGSYNAAIGVLSLDEIYYFDDGHTDRLHWRITKLDGGRYEAQEERLLEPGKGKAAGSVFEMSYCRTVPQEEGSDTTLSFEDTFVQIDDGTVMVRASIHKLLVPVGSMVVVFRRT